jgi:hypothetical protein
MASQVVAYTPLKLHTAPAYCYGRAGNDEIHGQSLSYNYIRGYGGSDALYGGSSDDSVVSTGEGWRQTGTAIEGGHAYNVYQAQVGNQTAQLLVDAAIKQSVG